MASYHPNLDSLIFRDHLKKAVNRVSKPSVAINAVAKETIGQYL